MKLGQGKKEHFIDTILKTDAFLVGLGYLEDEADKALLESISEAVKK